MPSCNNNIVTYLCHFIKLGWYRKRSSLLYYYKSCVLPSYRTITVSYLVKRGKLGIIFCGQHRQHNKKKRMNKIGIFCFNNLLMRFNIKYYYLVPNQQWSLCNVYGKLLLLISQCTRVFCLFIKVILLQKVTYLY